MSQVQAPERLRPAPVQVGRPNRVASFVKTHWLALVVTILAVAAYTVVMFEAGHAYAEGVRSVGGFIDHLGEMRETYLGAWLWRAPTAWLW
jgi:hypothetical protein